MKITTVPIHNMTASVYRYLLGLILFEAMILNDCIDPTSTHRRTGQHLFGGADRVLPEWIQWGGGVVAEIFRDPYSVGGGVAEIFRDPYYVEWLNFFR